MSTWSKPAPRHVRRDRTANKSPPRQSRTPPRAPAAPKERTAKSPPRQPRTPPRDAPAAPKTAPSTPGGGSPTSDMRSEVQNLRKEAKRHNRRESELLARNEDLELQIKAISQGKVRTSIAKASSLRLAHPPPAPRLDQSDRRRAEKERRPLPVARDDGVQDGEGSHHAEGASCRALGRDRPGEFVVTPLPSPP